MRNLDNDALGIDLNILRMAGGDDRPDVAIKAWEERAHLLATEKDRERIATTLDSKDEDSQRIACEACALSYQANTFAPKARTLILEVIEAINELGGLDPILVPEMERMAADMYQARVETELATLATQA